MFACDSMHQLSAIELTKNLFSRKIIRPPDLNTLDGLMVSSLWSTEFVSLKEVLNMKEINLKVTVLNCKIQYY